jgi:hypothetical protein
MGEISVLRMMFIEFRITVVGFGEKIGWVEMKLESVPVKHTIYVADSLLLRDQIPISGNPNIIALTRTWFLAAV